MIATGPDKWDADSPPGAAGPAPRAGWRARGIVLGLALGLSLSVAALVLFAWWGRAAAPRLTEEAYRAAVARWERNGPADYELDLELAGNRAGKIHVEVRQGQVVKMIRDGVEPRQRRTWDYWSVAGQLETIGQELEMARDPAAAFKSPAVTQMVLWAEFDPRYGFPRRYDRVVLGGDFEVHWRVTRFVDHTAEK